jgi:hypothetical protein
LNTDDFKSITIDLKDIDSLEIIQTKSQKITEKRLKIFKLTLINVVILSAICAVIYSYYLTQKDIFDKSKVEL